MSIRFSQDDTQKIAELVTLEQSTIRDIIRRAVRSYYRATMNALHKGDSK